MPRVRVQRVRVTGAATALHDNVKDAAGFLHWRPAARSDERKTREQLQLPQGLSKPPTRNGALKGIVWPIQTMIRNHREIMKPVAVDCKYLQVRRRVYAIHDES